MDYAEREIIEFARVHAGEDTAQLLLAAGRYPEIDMKAAVQQIEGLRTAREKWPSLPECADYMYPPRLNREQASSEATASYKSRIISSCSPGGLTKSIDPEIGFIDYAVGGEISLPFATLTKSIDPEIGFIDYAVGGGKTSPVRCAHEIHRSNGMTLKAGLRVADLTGGMGIDTLAFAKVAEHVDYVERDPQLCALMVHNLRALGVTNVTVHCADSLDWLSATPSPLSAIYLDPARRDSAGRKVAGFEDSTPNILGHLPLLLSRCSTLIVKASPMIDLDLACRQLGSVADVHVVELKGECKEALFVCRHDAAEPTIHCVTVGSEPFSFTRVAEAAAPVSLATEVGPWLYEPSAAVMKGGPYRLLAQRHSLAMLDVSTHLYTADRLVEGFPGRVFRVLQEVKATRKAVAEVVPEGKAHVVTRNYPVAAAELQRRLGLKEGGELFLVAATHAGRPRCWLCSLA